jgi:cobalt/nickel transport system ATP-binding protein
MAPILEARHLTYTYEDQTPALTDTSLTINIGEHIAILGPNGAGKSTLLHLLAGVKTLQQGTITILDEPLDKKNRQSLRTKIGIVFQDPDDQIFMPRVWDDIAFGPINQDLTADEVTTRVTWAMTHLGLQGYNDKVPHNLSYGEKKKVALAGVLAMKPDILLLDEPTANLDLKARKELLNLLTNLPTTIILATHDINAALVLAQRVYLINKKNIANGTTAEVFTKDHLLETVGLEQPDITQLFKQLQHAGNEFSHLPLTVQDAVKLLEKRILSPVTS